ncbi:MAG: phytoene desaturase family protein [Candidatus Helarchaeota archaeon]
MSDMEKFDCIIVGAGIAGLLTGAALSRAGLKLLMLEKTAILGGRSYCLERDGFIIDNGIHVIRYCKKSPTALIFKKLLGKREKLNLIKTGDAKLYADGKFYEYPLSASAIQTTSFFNDEEKEQFLKILNEEVIKADVEPLFEVSIQTWIDEAEKKYGIKPGPARLFLETLGKMMLVSYGELDKLSAGELVDGIKVGLKADKGSCYIRGGWKGLIERLAEIIREKGEIRTSSKVEKVIIEDAKVRGVLIGGKKIFAKIVVVNLPAQEIFTVLDEALFPSSFVEKCKTLIPSAGVSIDYGLKKKISDLDGNIFSAEPFTLSLFTSNLEPATAPEGKQLYTIFQPTPLEIINDKQKSAEIAENLEKLVEEMFPGFLKNVLWKRVMKYKIADGALPLITQHRYKRPSIKSEVVEGLYFTGDTYNGPGTGGEIAHASAELCIRTIMNDYKLAFPEK